MDPLVRDLLIAAIPVVGTVLTTLITASVELAKTNRALPPAADGGSKTSGSGDRARRWRKALLSWPTLMAALASAIVTAGLAFAVQRLMPFGEPAVELRQFYKQYASLKDVVEPAPVLPLSKVAGTARAPASASSGGQYLWVLVCTSDEQNWCRVKPLQILDGDWQDTIRFDVKTDICKQFHAEFALFDKAGNDLLAAHRKTGIAQDEVPRQSMRGHYVLVVEVVDDEQSCTGGAL